MKVKLAYLQLIVALIGWPVSAMTVAKDEPSFILGLSWWAVIGMSIDVIINAKTKEQVDKDAQS